MVLTQCSSFIIFLVFWVSSVSEWSKQLNYGTTSLSTRRLSVWNPDVLSAFDSNLTPIWINNDCQFSSRMPTVFTGYLLSFLGGISLKTYVIIIMMIIPYFVINTKHTWMHFIFDLNLIHCQVLDLGKRRTTCCTEKKRNENNTIHVFIRNAFPGFTLIGSAHINIFQMPRKRNG